MIRDNASRNARTWRTAVLVTAFTAALMSMPQVILSAPAGGRPPNFVLMVIDDLGWADLGCYGSRFYETGNVDRLAAGGMRFTSGYAACPVCSPTRACIMTGKYPARLQLTDFLVGRRTRKDSPVLPAPYRHELALQELTIAEALKSAGYKTGHIGKWHLGGEPFFPEHQGFDVNVGGSSSGMPRSYFWPKWGDNPPIVGRREGEYLTDRLADEAVRFIEESKDTPFFLYFCHYAVHIPLEAKEDMIAKYRAKDVDPRSGQDNPVYAAMIESVDQSVGRVMETLERLRIEDRTVVIFTSDNGGLAVQEGLNTPATCNAPLRGGKGYLYEGGIRVPWIIKWPGVVQPGRTCDVPVTSADIFPTILEIAGVAEAKTSGPIDGESIVPLLNQTGGLQRDDIFWHYPHFSNQGDRPGGAIRRGQFKLIERYEDGTLELYDLGQDIGETKNLAPAMPARAAALARRLREWRESVNATMPPPNPDYASADSADAGPFVAAATSQEPLPPDTQPAVEKEQETFGARPDALGPIGGDEEYAKIVTGGDFRVRTIDELAEALQKAKSGQVVYVEDDAELDLTVRVRAQKLFLGIPAGVTLASGRGHDGSSGALIYSNELNTAPLIEVGGEKVRITGLRIRGPDPETHGEELRRLLQLGGHELYYAFPTSDGIRCAYPGLEVDNCELSGWGHAGVFLPKGGTKAHVHHNYIHHCQRQGLGYGVCLDSTEALIESNVFSHVRHAIAATGAPGTRYEARNNLVLGQAGGHSFDMHGGADRKDGTDIAGDWIKIHHNTFRAKEKANYILAICIRGQPIEGGQVHHNWFLETKPGNVFRQNVGTNVRVYRNQYGPARVVKD